MARKILFKFVLATVLATGAMTIMPVESARATSLAPLSVDQMTDASDYIVRGTVQEVWTEVDDRGLVWTRARLAVSETFKGPDQPSEIIIDSLGGTYGAVSTEMEGRARFTVTEEMFVFLTRNDLGRYVPVAKFLGKYTIRRAPDVNRKYAVTWHGRANFFDARFLPHPEEKDRVYLDSLMEQVQTRLDTGWDGKRIPGLTLEKTEAINTIDRRIVR